jgi:hypothetical protein
VLGVIESAIPDSEVLIGIATLGLTLTGFSGLVAIMGQRGTGTWTTGERIQFIQLAAVSLAVTFSSFVPILASTELSDAVSLRVSNGIIALVHAACMSHGLFNVMRASEVRNSYGLGLVLFMTGGGILLILAGIGCALNLLHAQALVMLLNLLWMFFVAVINFIQLLVRD